MNHSLQLMHSSSVPADSTLQYSDSQNSESFPAIDLSGKFQFSEGWGWCSVLTIRKYEDAFIGNILLIVVIFC